MASNLAAFFQNLLRVSLNGNALLPARKILNFLSPLQPVDNPQTGAIDIGLDATTLSKLNTLASQAEQPFFAGLFTTSSASPQTIGARIVNAGTSYPWATRATLVVGIVVNSTGPAHADLYDELATPVPLVLVTIDQAATTYAELTADVTAYVIGQPAATLAVRIYTDAGSAAATFAAIRFS